MPLLVNVQTRYGARGVVVVGASADEESTREQIQPFIEKLHITFPIWTGATTEHMKALELGGALPATAILDRDGASRSAYSASSTARTSRGASITCSGTDREKLRKHSLTR